MEKERAGAIAFVQSARGFDDDCKIKLSLFLAKQRQAAYVQLKIYSDNLDEKYHFEKHLKKAGIDYAATLSKSFEEVTKIDLKKQRIVWEIKGVWIGYDLFNTKEAKKLFQKYKQLKRQGKQALAEKMGAKIYSIPPCCARKPKEFTRQSYYSHYREIHQLEKNFPFLPFQPHSLQCRKAAALHQKYKTIIRQLTPRFYKQYLKPKPCNTRLIVDYEEDILKNGKSIWKTKDGHDYAVTCLRPCNGKCYTYYYLTRQQFPRGTLLSATVIMKGRTADIRVHRIKKQHLEKLHHEKKLPLLAQ